MPIEQLTTKPTEGDLEAEIRPRDIIHGPAFPPNFGAAA